MDDLERMKVFYGNKLKDEWSVFNCYPFFLDYKQTFMMTRILDKVNLKRSKFLDIGAREGNFILKMISFGIKHQNIMAIEYLEDRYNKLIEKLPNIESVNDDFLNMKLENKYDIITLMAVLTSITDNNIRYSILEKSLNYISEDGMIILYDYFDDDEKFLNENYRALSLNKVKQAAQNYKVKVYTNVYLNSKYIKGLCKIGLQSFIPLVESLKIFNDSYHFVVIINEK